MRVSSLTHENAINDLFLIQELEPDTWDRLVDRLPGIHTAGHQDLFEMFRCPKDLPAAFGSWREYRDYLVEYLGRRQGGCEVQEVIRG